MSHTSNGQKKKLNKAAQPQNKKKN